MKHSVLKRLLALLALCLALALCLSLAACSSSSGGDGEDVAEDDQIKAEAGGSVSLPEGFTAICHTAATANAGIQCKEKNLYGVQFHPEVEHTQFGNDILKNFLYEICHAKGDWSMKDYARSTVEAAAESGATAAFCVGGLQPTIFELIKEKGMKLIVRPLTPTVKNAREAQAMGADIFVATGYDAGGFLPSHHTGTFSIVPTIVDAVTIPVLAADGINDLRGVRAAFALGAEGVYVGTRFIATNECAANDHAKELICKLSGSNLLSVDETQRSLPTEFAAEAYVKHRLAPTVPTTVDLVGALRTGMYDGEPDKGIVTVNTGIDVIRSVVPTAQVVSELMADFLRYADFLKAKASAEEATPKA